MATTVLSYPRFVVAKYVPDLKRMEPKNIGVFVWAKGDIRARFAAPAPAFVNDSEVYDRWTTFWNSQVAEGVFRSKRGKPVTKNDPAAVDTLIATQKGEYLLVEAGEFVHQIAKRDIDAATDMLFCEFVVGTEQRARTSPTRQTFEMTANDILERATLKSRPDFHRNYQLECPVYGIRKHLQFHYGIGNGNGSTKALIQRVDVSRDVAVHSTALMVHCVTETAILNRKHCAVLYQSTADDTDTKRENIRLLKKVCRLIDVDNADEASGALEALPAR